MAGSSVKAKRVRRVRIPNGLLARLIPREHKEFVLQIVQPSLVGMIDGTVSTLAPIFAAAVSSGSRTALLVGIATALGAGVSMGISEALSDTGEQTGRGSAVVRGTITGAATTFGGIFHSLPFIIGNVNQALVVAGYRGGDRAVGDRRGAVSVSAGLAALVPGRRHARRCRRAGDRGRDRQRIELSPRDHLAG